MSKEHLDSVMVLVEYVLERAASGDSIPDKPGSLGELRRTLLRKLEELPLSSQDDFLLKPSAGGRQMTSTFQAKALARHESHPVLQSAVFMQSSSLRDAESPNSEALGASLDNVSRTSGLDIPSHDDVLLPSTFTLSLDPASILEGDSSDRKLSGCFNGQGGMEVIERNSACPDPSFIALSGYKATLNISSPSEPRPQQWLNTHLGLTKTANNGDAEYNSSFVISQEHTPYPNPGERYALTHLPRPIVRRDFNFSVSQRNMVAQMAPPLHFDIKAQNAPADGSYLANNGQPRTFGSQFAPSYHVAVKKSSVLYLPIAESSHRPAGSLKRFVEIGLSKGIPLQFLSPSLEFMPNLPSPSPATATSERTPLGASGYVNTARNSQDDDVAPRPLKRKRTTSPATSKFSTGIRCRLPGCNKPNFEFASIRERNKHEKCAKAHSTSLPSCGICRKVLSRDDAVRRHMELIHGKENEDISWLEQPADREEA
ncbi:hypothetical protein ACEPAF_8694 [Sanghuangporus sanghuang]